ncbi:hypothetical protein EAO14_28185 [Klebsiella pneumoniae]|nr:hypothetical protein EAO14_28185 [Klebsiella pneumoniae]
MPVKLKQTLTLAKKVYNRPVGLRVAETSNCSKEAENKLRVLLDGVADFWMNGDSAGIGGMDSNAGPYDINTRGDTLHIVNCESLT